MPILHFRKRIIVRTAKSVSMKTGENHSIVKSLRCYRYTSKSFLCHMLPQAEFSTNTALKSQYQCRGDNKILSDFCRFSFVSSFAQIIGSNFAHKFYLQIQRSIQFIVRENHMLPNDFRQPNIANQRLHQL